MTVVTGRHPHLRAQMWWRLDIPVRDPAALRAICLAVATRYDQLADSFLGMLYIATARYWIKFVHAA
jgi:transposase